VNILPSALCLPSVVCRVFTLEHSAKKVSAVCPYFAECLGFDTWQRRFLPSARRNALGKTSRHTANNGFPVVIAAKSVFCKQLQFEIQISHFSSKIILHFWKQKLYF
jgi:hypothetical protein